MDAFSERRNAGCKAPPLATHAFQANPVIATHGLISAVIASPGSAEVFQPIISFYEVSMVKFMGWLGAMNHGPGKPMRKEASTGEFDLDISVCSDSSGWLSGIMAIPAAIRAWIQRPGLPEKNTAFRVIIQQAAGYLDRDWGSFSHPVKLARRMV